jgi:hypothetical protein
MRILTTFLAVAVAVGLCAGVAQAAFDYTDTATRTIILDGEGLQDQGCVNRYNNTTGFPPTPIAPCTTTGANCPNHPNLRAAVPSCTVYANSGPPSGTAPGPFFAQHDPAGTPSNDYFALAQHVSASTWRVTTTNEVWGMVTQRTLGQSNATVRTAEGPMDMYVDFAATGPGSMRAVNQSGPSGGPEFYRGSAIFAGATTLGLFGSPTGRDAPYFGQSQDPLTFAVPDAGIPLQFSCNLAANQVPPTGFLRRPRRTSEVRPPPYSRIWLVWARPTRLREALPPGASASVFPGASSAPMCAS